MGCGGGGVGSGSGLGVRSGGGDSLKYVSKVIIWKQMLAAMTHFAFSGSPMHCSNLWRSVVGAPFRLREIICFLLAILEQIRNRTRLLLHAFGFVVQLHLVIFISHFVWQTTGPCLDLIKRKLVLIISALADIYFLITWEVTRSALAEAGDEHDETAVHDLLYSVVPVLPSFDHFTFVKMLVVSVHCLFGAVVPACIDEFLTVSVLPCSIDL